jgi:hypothetical protein
MKIELDENHKYSVDGKPYPGVTEILGGCGIIDDTWFTEQDAIRGTHIHMACQYLDEGCLDRDTVDPLYLPYLMAYEKFLRECKPKWEVIEFKVFNKDYLYAGTLDRFGTMFNEQCCVDLKSGTPQKWVGCQLSGYTQALASMYFNTDGPFPSIDCRSKRYGLYLSKYGTYYLKEYNNRDDWRGFTAALNVWKWKHNK